MGSQVDSTWAITCRSIVYRQLIGRGQQRRRQEYGRRLPDRDGEHARARCFLHLFSAGGNTAGRFGVPSCTGSPTPAHSVGHVVGTHIDAPGGGATRTPNEPGDENVDRGEICALRGNCSGHRRYCIGCDQETENDSPSRRRTRSDFRPAPRPARQPIQSCGHGRWHPWLQSNARALLTKKRFAKGLRRCSQRRPSRKRNFDGRPQRNFGRCSPTHALPTI